MAMMHIVHHADYDARSVDDLHRFPMRKYLRTAQTLRDEGFEARHGAFLEPVEASANWLELAHSPVYVDAILSRTIEPRAARKIGFEITSGVVRRSRLAVAGTILAARLALDDGLACNLAGGSHHAKTSEGAGFCVFNDVAVAIRLLQAEGFAGRILVVDCDVHQGDGTAEIFAGDRDIFTLSLHCETNWPVRKVASTRDIGLEAGTEDAAYLAALRPALDEALDTHRPALVFYNAGVDPHVDDRLGKLGLTQDGLFRPRQRCP